MFSSYPPLLRALCDRFTESPEEVDMISDVDLYTEIVFSESVLHGGIGDEIDSAAENPAVLDRIEKRLSTGWFTTKALASPQARYSSESELPPIHLWGPEDWVGMASKPHGAMWTSSFLPDGTSAWRWGEPEVARQEARMLYELHFDANAVNIYTINSQRDYTELVRKFPVRTSDGRINVHWKQVAEDFDAVHLTAAGMLYSTGAKAVVQGLTSMLMGWSAESTAWFRSPPGASVHPVR